MQLSLFDTSVWFVRVVAKPALVQDDDGDDDGDDDIDDDDDDDDGGDDDDDDDKDDDEDDDHQCLVCRSGSKGRHHPR